jgi:hypothetical protein
MKKAAGKGFSPQPARLTILPNAKSNDEKTAPAALN